MHTRGKGKQGEELATGYLLEQGYTIVHQNFQTRHGEIDCIARDPDGTLVFLEVKVSSSARYGSPLYRVTPAKQRRIAMMARLYCARNRITGPMRLDVIAIHGGHIEHLKNAFFAA